MKYVISFPLLNRYVWEARVQIVNFIGRGIKPSDIHYVILSLSEDKERMDMYTALCTDFPDVNFHLYHDFRDLEYRHTYPPTARPHAMKMFAGSNPDIVSRPFMYLDSDVIFIGKPDFDDFAYNEHWYGSNVASYIGAKYILEYRSQNIIGDMASLLEADAAKILTMPDEAIIGAQVIMKNTDEFYWANVERYSHQLYKYLEATHEYYQDLFNKKQNELKRKGQLHSKSATEYKKIQSWTADMWAVLWAAWNRDIKTISTPKMDFVMASEKINPEETRIIYHNNGIQTKDKNPLAEFHSDNAFYKQQYIETTPFDEPLKPVDSRSATTYYVKAIEEYKLYIKLKNIRESRSVPDATKTD